MPSRGDSISGYFPSMEGTSGLKSYLSNLKAQVISGTIISANVAYAKAHQLGLAPKFIGITPKLAVDQAKNFTSGVVIGQSAASAATTTNFYVIGNKAGVKYTAFLLI